MLKRFTAQFQTQAFANGELPEDRDYAIPGRERFAFAYGQFVSDVQVE